MAGSILDLSAVWIPSLSDSLTIGQAWKQHVLEDWQGGEMTGNLGEVMFFTQIGEGGSASTCQLLQPGYEKWWTVQLTISQNLLKSSLT